MLCGELSRAGPRDSLRRDCCWWLLLAMPRMLQRRSVRGGVLNHGRQAQSMGVRLRRFAEYDWELLYEETVAAGEKAEQHDRLEAARRAAVAAADPAAAAAEEEQRTWQRAAAAALRHLAAGDFRPAMQRLVGMSGLARGSTAEVAAKLRQLHPETDKLTQRQRTQLIQLTARIHASWSARDAVGAGGQAGGSGTAGGSSAHPPTGGSGGGAQPPAGTPHEPPLIALCMGAAGRLSRVANAVLTPVTHACLPLPAAPGQLTLREVRAQPYGDARTQAQLLRDHMIMPLLCVPHHLRLLA
jgi:hypothetical protein